MARPDHVGTVIVLTLIIALVAAILLFGKIALDLVELPGPAASLRYAIRQEGKSNQLPLNNTAPGTPSV